MRQSLFGRMSLQPPSSCHEGTDRRVAFEPTRSTASAAGR